MITIDKFLPSAKQPSINVAKYLFLRHSLKKYAFYSLSALVWNVDSLR